MLTEGLKDIEHQLAFSITSFQEPYKVERRRIYLVGNRPAILWTYRDRDIV